MNNELLNHYKNHLINDKKSGKATVKNYIADVRKFISWYETRTNIVFTPQAVSKEIASEYLNGTSSGAYSSDTPSASSLKRYASSMRKFYLYLIEQNIATANPFEIEVYKNTVPTDPWRLKEFKNYLFLSNISKVTQKNYLIDIRQFTDWAQTVIIGTEMPANGEARFQRPVEGSVLRKVDSSLVEVYKTRLLTEANLSPVSINRKLSSLRKYFHWAQEQHFMKEGITITSEAPASMPNIAAVPLPIQTEPITEKQPLTLESLKEFEAEKEEAVITPASYSKFPPLRLMQKSGKLAGVIISSIILVPIDKTAEFARYTYWKASGRKVFAPIEEVIGEAAPIVINEAKNQLQAQIPSNHAIKIAKMISLVTQKINFDSSHKVVKVQGFPKSFYAPLAISTQNLPMTKRVWHHLRHKRPAWYHRYHSYKITHYIHLGVLLAATSMIGFHVYTTLAERTDAQIAMVASPSQAPPRTLSFQGKLNDDTNTPITAETTLRFAIYKSPTASGTAQLWEETQRVKPDHEGTFSVLLGRKTMLRQEIFTDYPSLFLGISVGNDEELKPRHPLATVTNATNANTLQGLKPITQTNAGTKNVVLALDSAGNLTIGSNASPVFQATGGEFTLSGQVLTLTTNPGSNSNIQIKPDGSGIIDMQKPIQNTSEYSNNPSFAGAVQIEDVTAINATSSGQSALNINQNSSGLIISATAKEIAKFTIDNAGNGFFGGHISLNGNKLASSANSFDLINTNAININFGGAATAISIAASTGTTTINNSLKVKGVATLDGNLSVTGLVTAAGGITIPAGKALTINDLKPGSIPFINDKNQLSSDSGNLHWDFANKRLGIGTTSPASKLAVANLETGTGTALVIDSSGNIFKNSSSRRYKDNINSLQTNTLILLNTIPVSFTYKDTGMHDIGFIAEDFDALGLKDLVVYNKEGKPDAIKYDKLSIYILEIVKQQQAAINTLKETLATIKAGYIEVSKNTTEVISIISEDITVGGQSLKDYIAKIASDNSKNNAQVAQTTVASPIASASAEPVSQAFPEQSHVATSSALFVDTIASPSGIAVSNTDTLYNTVSSQSGLPSPIPAIQTSSSISASTVPAEPQSALFQPGNIMNIKYEGPNTNYADIASFSAELAYVPNFKSDYATFNQGLIALGPTSLTDVGVSGKISVGGNLQITDNAINTIGSDLNLQPLRQGNVAFMGGLIMIDIEGNLTVGGNATFAKDVNVKGKLAAGLIAPVPNQDLLISLPAKDEINGSSLVVKNATGSSVLAINQKGDVLSSGEGKFNTIASKDFKIIRGVQADTSLVETVADGAAGTGVITAYETERTIKTPYVTKHSLIYVTATSNTQQVTPYVARQTDSSFTIQIPSRLAKDFKFNWWIVN